MTTDFATARPNRVPEVTLEFWLIKLMAVTMGETAADYLAVNLGLGLTATSLLMTGVLLVALVLQFAQRRYVPWAYWLAVVLISIVGTLVTDNLVDNFGVPLIVTTAVFTVALAVTSAPFSPRWVVRAARCTLRESHRSPRLCMPRWRATWETSTRPTASRGGRSRRWAGSTWWCTTRARWGTSR